MMYASKNEAVFCEVQTHFGSSPLTRFTSKNSGCIFMIHASENRAVCCEVQTHFGSSSLAKFTKKILDAFSQCMHPKAKLFAMKFRHIFEVLCLQGL